MKKIDWIEDIEEFEKCDYSYVIGDKFKISMQISMNKITHINNDNDGMVKYDTGVWFYNSMLQAHPPIQGTGSWMGLDTISMDIDKFNDLIDDGKIIFEK